MKIEFWKARGAVSFARDETITVRDGRGRAVERITVLKVVPNLKDDLGEFTGYRMSVVANGQI